MPFKNLFLISLVALCSVQSKTHPLKSQQSSTHASKNNTVLLEYTGSLSSPYAAFNIGVQVAIDTTIGLRYEVTFQKGTAVMSHIAIFYKFSKPYQSIFYNYLNHKSEVITYKQSEGSANVNVVGKEQIDSFPCTHLQHTNDHGSEDYWMSTSLPGFAQLAKTLNTINPMLMASVDETIFNWGGLVRLQMVSTTKQGTTTMLLNLIEAATGLNFSAKDFEPPSK